MIYVLLIWFFLPLCLQVLKRRSSVLENDIGSVGPIRRIRQKPNLLPHKTLSRPPAGVAHVKHESECPTDFSKVPPSIEWSSNPHSSSKALPDTDMPSTSNGYVPSQSIEMAEKIFQQLDKFTSKGKSPEKKFDVGGSSIGKKTLEIRDGSPRKNMNTVDSLKILQTKDIRKENVSLDSHSNALNHSPKTSQKAEEGKLKKISFVEDAAEAETPSKSLDNVNAQSSFSHQQKKRAFQMSAHEVYIKSSVFCKLGIYMILGSSWSFLKVKFSH